MDMQVRSLTCVQNQYFIFGFITYYPRMASHDAAINAVKELAAEGPLSPSAAAAYALGFKAGAAAKPEDEDMSCGGAADAATGKKCVDSCS
jgi:hypothetical protein